MTRFVRPLALSLCVVAAAAAAPMHFAVTKSSPAKDQTVKEAPKRLQVWFSQAPATVVSEMKLKKGADDVALGKVVVVAADKTMYADPVKPLVNGAYILSWRAAGDDGHVLSGEIKFTVDIKPVP
jgi:methionine-rich copper-binding protein CopC